jgi:hypothetical protein
VKILFDAFIASLLASMAVATTPTDARIANAVGPYFVKAFDFIIKLLSLLKRKEPLLALILLSCFV